jgi:hypothetical protein
MASYTVNFDMRKDNYVTSSTRTVTAESEATAIRIVEGQAKAARPGYAFILKSVVKK